ncbi:hypothetical protein GCM10022224_087300 [Nonomuraea antimicrobica]|uniref:Uncharacterized protein n=1 Tax=Nonomuraea antimicrobica TaxID=561173 RepID=A0ABP7DSK2_9ACTN
MGIHGLDPQRARRVAELEAECRPLLGWEDGMEAVQRLLADRGVSVIDSILVTRQLLGAGPSALGEAKAAVLGSAARTTDWAHHGRSVADLLARLEDDPDIQVYESGDQ